MPRSASAARARDDFIVKKMNKCTLSKLVYNLL